MDFELQAASEVGRSFVSLCESHEKDFSRSTRMIEAVSLRRIPRTSSKAA